MSKQIEELSEALDAYCDQERIHRMDHPRELTKIVRAIGYNDTFRDNLEQFLEDNPGACEAVYSWITEQNVPEWREAVVSKISSCEGDEDE